MWQNMHEKKYFSGTDNTFFNEGANTCFDNSFVNYCTFTIFTYKSKFDTTCNYMSFEYYYSLVVCNSYFPFNIQQGHIAVRVI